MLPFHWDGGRLQVQCIDRVLTGGRTRQGQSKPRMGHHEGEWGRVDETEIHFSDIYPLNIGEDLVPTGTRGRDYAMQVHGCDSARG